MGAPPAWKPLGVFEGSNVPDPFQDGHRWRGITIPLSPQGRHHSFLNWQFYDDLRSPYHALSLE